MYDVITFGSATVDIFAKSKSELIKIFNSEGETDLLAFQTGSKLLINDLHYSLGGGGTNAAAAFSKLGLKTAFVGKVGDGYNGNLIIDYLKKHKIDTRFVVRGKKHSGLSIILDNLEKDRVILAHKGINDSLSKSEVKLNQLKTRWIYSSSLVGRSFETLKTVVKHAKKNNIKVAFNPSSYITEKGIPFLLPILSNTEILVLNLKEAMLLTKKDSVKSILKELIKTGPKIVVITEGKKGVHITDSKYVYKSKSGKVKVVDTTGAGDAFASTFVAGIIKNKDIETCIKSGIENAQSVVKQVGAKTGLLPWAKVISGAKKKNIKITKKEL